MDGNWWELADRADETRGVKGWASPSHAAIRIGGEIQLMVRDASGLDASWEHAARIVDCVNALDGIEDPAAFVEAAIDNLYEGKGWLPREPGDGWTPCDDDDCCCHAGPAGHGVTVEHFGGHAVNFAAWLARHEGGGR